MENFSFAVPGDPKGKGRPRFDAGNGRVYTPRGTAEYEEYVRWCFLKETGGAEPLKGAVSIRVEACFGIPKSRKKEEKEKMAAGKILPLKKPDCDNILKIIADALNGLAYEDDKQIAEAAVVKRYAAEPCVKVFVGTVLQDAKEPSDTAPFAAEDRT